MLNAKKNLKYYVRLGICINNLSKFILYIRIRTLFFFFWERELNIIFLYITKKIPKFPLNLNKKKDILFEMQKISRSFPYGDLADGDVAVVSWLALDAIFPSEIIALRSTEKLPGPWSWCRSSRHVADVFYSAKRIRVRWERG